MRPISLVTSIAAVFSFLVGGCGGGGAGGHRTTPDSVRIPDVVDDGSYSGAVRLYHGLDLDDPARPQLRERIVRYLGRLGSGDVETRDYDAIVDRFAEITDLYSPEDFSENRLPRELVPLARYLESAGSTRGDEARVLSALRVLH